MIYSLCDCGRTIPAGDENSQRYGACFHCRIQGVGITFRGGGGYGRKQFNESTNAEFIRENSVEGSEPRR